jgi:hypothetical protein
MGSRYSSSQPNKGMRASRSSWLKLTVTLIFMKCCHEILLLACLGKIGENETWLAWMNRTYFISRCTTVQWVTRISLVTQELQNMRSVPGASPFYFWSCRTEKGNLRKTPRPCGLARLLLEQQNKTRKLRWWGNESRSWSLWCTLLLRVEAVLGFRTELIWYFILDKRWSNTVQP